MNRNERVNVLLFEKKVSLPVIKVLENSKGIKYKLYFQILYRFVNRISIDQEMLRGTKHWVGVLNDGCGVWFSEYQVCVNENISGACRVKITNGNESSDAQLFQHKADG